MKKLIILFAAVVLGCQQGPGPITDADKDAIKQRMQTFANAMVNDIENVGAGYADKAVSMPPNAETNISPGTAAAFFQRGPKPTKFELNPEVIEGLGTLAFARGTFVFEGILNDTINISDKGKFLATFEKEADGSWKVTQEIWNSDLPIGGQE